MFTSCRSHHRRKGDNDFHRIQLSHHMGIVLGRFSKRRFVFFSLSICQPIPAAAKKLTIRKAAAYRCDKLVDVRTVKCMKIEKADLKREKRGAALRARFTI